MHTIARRRGYRVTRSRSMVRFFDATRFIIFFYRTFGTRWGGGIYAVNRIFSRGSFFFFFFFFSSLLERGDGERETRCCCCCCCCCFFPSFFLSFSVFVTFADFSLFSFCCTTRNLSFSSSSLLNTVARRRGGGHVRRGRRKLPEGHAARPHGATREWR
jgi:hypothetical protein